jgi:hypothetical protein
MWMVTGSGAQEAQHFTSHFLVRKACDERGSLLVCYTTGCIYIQL